MFRGIMPEANPTLERDMWVQCGVRGAGTTVTSQEGSYYLELDIWVPDFLNQA